MGKERDAAGKEAVEEVIAEEKAPTDNGEHAAEAEAPREAGQPNVEELEKLLEEARAKAEENWDQVMRARAEIENLRRRQEREVQNAHKFALERFLTELLPVRDSLELGLSAAQEEGAELAKLIEGKELTLKLLSDLMGRFNIEQIDPEGEPFNPEYHQAMSIQPRNDVPANTVVTVVQKGYTLNGRLVRPAMVIVSQAGGANESPQ